MGTSISFFRGKKQVGPAGEECIRIARDCRDLERLPDEDGPAAALVGAGIDLQGQIKVSRGNQQVALVAKRFVHICH